MNIEKIFFVSDLHGNFYRYSTLFDKILSEKPELVLIGGDILPSGISLTTKGGNSDNFLTEYVSKKLSELKNLLSKDYPEILVIMGNDDPKIHEDEVKEIESLGLWKYINMKAVLFKGYSIVGYSYVPPTPFLLKDWEKYDVSRFTDVGCVSPEEGIRSVFKEQHLIRHETIQGDLDILSKDIDLSNSIFLFHSPPYGTMLDKIKKPRMVDYIQPDENVGSIAIKRFIENKQPLLTLHGHIHEAASITGKWKEKIGNTLCINGSTDKKNLSLISLQISEKDIYAEKSLL